MTSTSNQIYGTRFAQCCDSFDGLKQIGSFKDAKHQIALYHDEESKSRLFFQIKENGEALVLPRGTQLELEGIPKKLVDISPFLNDTYHKIVKFAPHQFKVTINQRMRGGGWGEVGFGGSVAATALAAPLVLNPVGAAVLGGALVGAGVKMIREGWGRDENRFDGEFFKGAAKDGAAGAVGGLLGGMGGPLVSAVGAEGVLARQGIHAIANATSGIGNTVTRASLDLNFGTTEEKKRARENLTARNVLASGIGGAAGGLAGAHVGKGSANISNDWVRGGANLVGGTVAGGTAGAVGGGVTAVGYNVATGKAATDGVKSAMGNGGTAGMITGTNAASRVSAKHFKIKFAAKQVEDFTKGENISLSNQQKKILAARVERKVTSLNLKDNIQKGQLSPGNLEELEEMGCLELLNNPNLTEKVRLKIASRPPKIVRPSPKPTALKDQAVKARDTRNDPRAPKSSDKKSQQPPKHAQQRPGSNDPSNKAAQNPPSGSYEQKGMEAANQQLDLGIDRLEAMRADAVRKKLDTSTLDEMIQAAKGDKFAISQPTEYASKLYDSLHNAKDGEFSRAFDIGEIGNSSKLYYVGDQAYLIDGKLYDQIFDKGEAGKEFLQEMIAEGEFAGKVFDLSNRYGKGELYRQLQDGVQELRSNAINKAAQRNFEKIAETAPDFQVFNQNQLDQLNSLMQKIGQILSQGLPVDPDKVSADLDAMNRMLADLPS